MADARMGQYGGAGMMPGRISGGGMQGMLLGVNNMASALNAINAIVGQFSDPAMIAATNADGPRTAIGITECIAGERTAEALVMQQLHLWAKEAEAARKAAE